VTVIRHLLIAHIYCLNNFFRENILLSSSGVARDASCGPCQGARAPAQLADAVRDFVASLERHLRSEEDQLASGRGAQHVPATVTLGGHPHEWYLLTEGPVVDLDAVLPQEAVSAAVDRLLRMRRGEKVELCSGTSLDPVWREISELCPGVYQFTVLQDGPTRWRMLITRRQAAI
jgi:uncharacterized protein (DUF2249 family)